MLYDPENREVYFSTEMIQSEADANASYEHFKAYQQACINNPGIMFKNQMRDADGVPSNAKTAVGVIAGIAFILCIIAAVLCIPIKKYEYIPWIIGALMLVLGIIPFVASKPQKAAGFAESVLCQRIGGAVSLLGAAGLIAVHFLYPKDNMTLYLLSLLCEIAAVLFFAIRCRYSCLFTHLCLSTTMTVPNTRLIMIFSRTAKTERSRSVRKQRSG